MCVYVCQTRDISRPQLLGIKSRNSPKERKKYIKR